MKRQFNPDRILALRLALKLSQGKLAKRMGDGFTKQHISNWELGKSIPDTSSLLAIVNAFDVNMDYFFN